MNTQARDDPSESPGVLTKAQGAVVRSLSFALQVGDSYAAWSGFAFILSARLKASERAAIAWAALKSLDPDQAEAVKESVSIPSTRAGTPVPPFDTPEEEASFWVQYASEDEIDAYALATVRAMSPERRNEFLQYLNKAGSST